MLYHSRSSQNSQIAPGSERGGIDRTKKEIAQEKIILSHNIMTRLPRPRLGTERGGM